MDAQEIPKEWWTYHHSHCGVIYRGCHPTLCPKNVYEKTGKWIGREKMKDGDIYDVFLKQLVKVHPVREETRRYFSGKTIFGKEYENGDVVVWFMLQTIVEIPVESIYTEPAVTFNMRSVTRDELDKFDEEYVLVGMSPDRLPIFEPKKKGEENVKS